MASLFGVFSRRNIFKQKHVRISSGVAKTNVPRHVAICFQEERSCSAPVRWASRGLVVGMVIAKEGQTGSGTSQQEALRSPGFGYLLAEQRFPESKRAIRIMKRLYASWSENSCGLGGETEMKHPESC